MIIPESTAALHFDRASTPVSYAALKRFGRWAATKGWVHALLLMGLAACLYPMVWMFTTSIMTDEELGQSDAAPSLPVFRGSSPYVRVSGEVTKPVDVDAARFSALLPVLRQLTLSAVSAGLPARTPASVDADLWASSAAPVLLNRSLAQMPRQVWDESAPAVADRYRALLGPDAGAPAISRH